MKKRLKRKSLSAAPQDEPGAAGLINKVEQQLSAIEKKLDILISQSSKKPFERSYAQKPPRRFSQSHHYDRGRQDDRSGERTYNRVICADCNKECEIPFKPSGDRPVYCKECFARRKQDNAFNATRDSRPEERDFSRERRSGKRRSERRQMPAKKDKPFFAYRKKRA